MWSAPGEGLELRYQGHKEGQCVDWFAMPPSKNYQARSHGSFAAAYFGIWHPAYIAGLGSPEQIGSFPSPAQGLMQDLAMRASLGGEVSHTSLKHLFETLFQGKRAIDERVAAGLRIIQRTAGNDPAASTLAREVGVSPNYLMNLFRKELGLSVRHCILSRKVTEAVGALGNGHTLTDASHLAGFSDLSHFSRTFRQFFGFAPKDIFRGGEMVRFCAD